MAGKNGRSKDEVVLDIRYQIRLHALHQRYYRRRRMQVAAFSLIAGSTAIAGAIGAHHLLVLLAGATVAIASALDLVNQWAERGAKHGAWQLEMGRLLAGSANMSATELDSALSLHDAEVDDEIRTLTFIAFNDNVRSNGHEDWARPLPLRSKLLQIFN